MTEKDPLWLKIVAYTILALILGALWIMGPKYNFWNYLGTALITLGAIFLTGIVSKWKIWILGVNGISIATFVGIAIGFLLLTVR